MIFQPPFYRSPFFYNPTYKNQIFNKNVHQNAQTSSQEIPPTNPNMETSSTEFRKENTANEFIELFGIKLYFDDILILCLLYFLYKQDVQDPLLFIALLLLLLS